MEIETLKIDGITYQIKIHYEKRNNSTASIRRKSINIRIPSILNREQRFKQLMKIKSWIVKKLKENSHKFKPKIQKEYKNNEVLKIGTEQYIINLDFKNKQSSSAKIIGNIIQLSISVNLSKEKQNNHISNLISRCIASKKLPELKEKINELNNKHFNQKINKIFFKNTISMWGSCSKSGNINISTRLLFAPMDILDYVCIHELAHLVEPNHSNSFWELVKKAIPDYKEKIKWLKENRDKCQI